SYADYLALEEASEIKHEYIDGVVRPLAGDPVAMAGGTIEHGRLAMRLVRLLAVVLDGRPCEAFSADVKVRIEASNRTTYPDLSIVCGPLERSPVDAEAITNPIIIV